MQKEEEMFYLLVAGSRTYNEYNEMAQVLDSLLSNQIKKNRRIVIVSGGANGADKLAERYADEKGYQKHVIFAEWGKFGKAAGFLRNEKMHVYISTPVDRKRGCVCFWDTLSKGTKQNFDLAYKYKTPLRIYDFINHKFLQQEISARSNFQERI